MTRLGNFGSWTTLDNERGVWDSRRVLFNRLRADGARYQCIMASESTAVLNGVFAD